MDNHVYKDFGLCFYECTLNPVPIFCINSIIRN